MAEKEAVSVVRRATLDRLRRATPSILVVSAPAGFGKTTLVRQYLGHDIGPSCDCGGVRDGLDLARRALPAFAKELEDGSRSIAERLSHALQAWKSDPRPVVVFEGVDAIGASASAAEFFAQLLVHRNERQQIVLVSRRPLRMKLTRFVQLHEIVSLRAEDLAFDFDDVREAFAGMIDDPTLLARIARVCSGWPVAVTLVLRFARDGRLLDHLDRVEDLIFDELHDYIAEEVMAGFTPMQRTVLFACAAIPHATASEITMVSADAPDGEAILEFAKESPFLERTSEGWFSIYPLLARYVLEHQRERKITALRRVAASLESACNFERAASLWLEAGDQSAAARALANHDILGDAAPSSTYRDVLSRLDLGLIQRYPSLWGVSALARIYCVNAQSLLDEADTIERTMGPNASPANRYFVFVFRTLLRAYLGRAADALPEADAYLPDSLYLRGFLRARVGRIADGEEDLNRALPFAGDVDVIAAATLLSLATDVARARGERAERQFLERSLVHARKTGLPNIVGLTLAHALFGAWFAGDEAAMKAFAGELDPYVAGGVRNFSYVANVAHHRAVDPMPDDLPEFVIYGRLIAISHTRDENERLRFAHSAYTHAKRLAMPFLATLAAIAVATCDEAETAKYLSLAIEHAAQTDSQALQSAVAAVGERRNDCGMLTAFVAQLLRGRFEAQAPIAVNAASGAVHVDGQSIQLGGRELELLLAISLRRGATTRAQLALMLWPDMDENAGRNSLAVCLHRLRARLGRKDAIEREGDGYRLHANADVDLWDFERLDAISASPGPLRERDRDDLEKLWNGTRLHQPLKTEHWEWFRATARRIADARIDLGHRLASDALQRGDARAALAFADDAISCDACDERARELAIRAHLAQGDRAAALREYRQYRDALRDDLGVEPSPAITALVG